MLLGARLELFLAKVHKTHSCWLWTGAKSEGYGRFKTNYGIEPAHRFAYEYYIGLVPIGKELDHLCMNRACVNPNHLEPVTRQENLLRGHGPLITKARHKLKTHCPQGHEYTEENTYLYNLKGYQVRTCRECQRAKNRRAYWRGKNATIT